MAHIIPIGEQQELIDRALRQRQAQEQVQTNMSDRKYCSEHDVFYKGQCPACVPVQNQELVTVKGQFGKDDEIEFSYEPNSDIPKD